MKKIGGVILTAAAVLSLSACSSQPKNQGSNDSAKFTKVTQKSKGHLSAKNLSPKENVVIITVYAAQKYGNVWQQTLKAGKQNGINVSFQNRDDADGDYKGQGYIYQVGNKGACYTIQGDGAQQVIYLYNSNHFLGSATVDEIVKYLNNEDSDALVKSLTNKVQIGGESSSDSDNSSDDSGSSSNIPGDAGIVTVPANLRGTWYGYNDGEADQVTFTEHRIIWSNGSDHGWQEFHKQKPGFDHDKNANVAKDTEHYSIGTVTNSHGILGLETYGWVQAAGAHEFYGVTTLRGQQVLLSINEAGGLQEIYWKSPDLAKKYAKTKFSELRKFGGIASDDSDE